MRETAIQAAYAAGAILEGYFEMTGLEREIKDDRSFVTKADTEAEAAIATIIKEAYPDHGFVGEEGNTWNPESPYQWIVDPLDGTGNFVNGIPLYAVSIALTYNGAPVLGVVYGPAMRALFVAEKGKGATYNDKPINVSDQGPKDGMVTFGPGRHESDRARQMVANVGPFMKSARLFGCTALELAYVARGGTEGYICIGLSPWDYAAGQLLVTEAGGKVTDYQGQPCDLKQNYFVASNGHAHESLLGLATSV